ncbi:DUF1996 domain-containing protein [Nonomuraea sp. NPDC050643]|uniref:DUF1996 domain-containing protein n=1 Tax=Nonomuraea sp. NPDC050643 TaxID=3155660 RepID=UPI0034117103
MRNSSGGRFRPWSGAVFLGAGIALVLAGPPVSAGTGVVRLDVSMKSAVGQTITCPNVADQLPEVPAAAQAEVDRNLAQLDEQLQEANNRLATSAGEGGPNFVQNAILGPLASKRGAAIDRIALAIGRVAARPTGLDGLATCTLGGGNTGSPAPQDTGTPAPEDTGTPAPEQSPPTDDGTATPPPGDGGAQTITCPNVADQLPEVPAAAQAEVDRNLAQLDEQLQEANNRLATSAGEGGPNFVQNAILGPLASKRGAAIDRIALAIGRVAARPTGLDDLATCTLDAAGTSDTGATGPSAADFVDIEDVAVTEQPRAGENASTGTFVSQCGTNSEGRSNPGNVITAPGVSEGAQTQYDYVGNMSADALSTNESLAESNTTCRNEADQSTYFWPVLRVSGSGDGTAEADGGAPVQPSQVRLEYRGNADSEVTAAPQFLRMLSGDPRAATNDGANARPTFTCTGFTDRLTDKYPICPSGSDLVRVLDMPSCWDGQNLDSADHRTHLAFPDESGACPSGTEAVPQLRITLTYDDVPAAAPDGTDVPFVVDGLDGEQNSPNTDHAGSINVMSKQLMNKVVDCVNSDRRC